MPLKKTQHPPSNRLELLPNNSSPNNSQTHRTLESVNPLLSKSNDISLPRFYFLQTSSTPFSTGGSSLHSISLRNNPLPTNQYMTSVFPLTYQLPYASSFPSISQLPHAGGFLPTNPLPYSGLPPLANPSPYAGVFPSTNLLSYAGTSPYFDSTSLSYDHNLARLPQSTTQTNQTIEHSIRTLPSTSNQPPFTLESSHSQNHPSDHSIASIMRAPKRKLSPDQLTQASQAKKLPPVTRAPSNSQNSKSDHSITSIMRPSKRKLSPDQLTQISQAKRLPPIPTLIASTKTPRANPLKRGNSELYDTHTLLPKRAPQNTDNPLSTDTEEAKQIRSIQINKTSTEPSSSNSDKEAQKSSYSLEVDTPTIRNEEIIPIEIQLHSDSQLFLINEETTIYDIFNLIFYRLNQYSNHATNTKKLWVKHFNTCFKNFPDIDIKNNTVEKLLDDYYLTYKNSSKRTHLEFLTHVKKKLSILKTAIYILTDFFITNKLNQPDSIIYASLHNATIQINHLLKQVNDDKATLINRKPLLLIYKGENTIKSTHEDSSHHSLEEVSQDQGSSISESNQLSTSNQVLLHYSETIDCFERVNQSIMTSPQKLIITDKSRLSLPDKTILPVTSLSKNLLIDTSDNVENNTIIFILSDQHSLNDLIDLVTTQDDF